MNPIIIKPYENFTVSNVKYFLDKVSFIFDCTNKRRPNAEFFLDHIKKIDVLGLILVYKFFDFTVKQHCFSKPKCVLSKKSFIYRTLKQYGFLSIIYDFINENPPEYENLRAENIDSKLVIEPIFLYKDSEEDEISNNSKAICRYYNQSEIVKFVVLTCMGEIASNFRSHAVSDTKSILAAKGSNEFFEFACADTGDGIISTLRPSLNNNGRDMQPFKIVEKAINKGISSKNKRTTNHMGIGLWLVNELVTLAKGELHIYSENAYYINRHGISKGGESSYWKGTIVYVKIPLTNMDSLKDSIKQIMSVAIHERDFV